MAEKKRKRGKNWSSEETILLIESKKWIRGKGISSAAERWQAISEHLEEQNVVRDVEQCRSKWENMIGDYKSIIEYQKRGLGSYFLLTKEQRKALKLPGKFSEEIFMLMSSGRTELECPGNSSTPGGAFATPLKTNGELVDVLQFREGGTSKKTRGGEVEEEAGGDGELVRTILEAHEKLMEFLKEREVKRSELEERRLELEKERMAAEKEDRVKIHEALSSMASAWRKMSEELLNNPT